MRKVAEFLIQTETTNPIMNLIPLSRPWGNQVIPTWALLIFPFLGYLPPLVVSKSILVHLYLRTGVLYIGCIIRDSEGKVNKACEKMLAQCPIHLAEFVVAWLGVHLTVIDLHMTNICLEGDS